MGGGPRYWQWINAIDCFIKKTLRINVNFSEAMCLWDWDDWNRGSGQRGTVKKAGVDNAGVDNVARSSKGGQRGSGQRGTK